MMGAMQRYLHKLDLAVRADNVELAAFYLHEVEEVAEEIVDEVPEYDGRPVSQLVESTLEPGLEALETAIENGDGMTTAMRQLIDACNNCHRATDHAYIVIERASSNPFNQDFSVRSDN